MARDDDEGQVDGDYSGHAQFQSTLKQPGQPWLRQSIPPWHMWGTTEQVNLRSQVATTAPSVPTTQQLSKINYKRPESWHWLFTLRLVSGPDALLLTDHPVITCAFDVLVGLGRSVVLLQNFETYLINWNGPAFAAPISQSAQIWSTQTDGPPRNLIFNDTPSSRPTVASQLVAQDIQVQARLTFQHSPANTPAVVEIGSFWSPRTHVRPDWTQEGPNEIAYAGDEVGGR